MSQKKVDIIIVNWNSKDDTLKCLRSLAILDYSNYEVIVVDNASSDGSAEAIKQAYPNVIVIESQENLGYGAGCNLAMRERMKVGVDYFWFLNADTRVEQETLACLVKTAEEENLGLVSSVLYFDTNPPKIQNCGGSLDWKEYRSFNHTDPVEIEDVEPHNFWLWGTSLLVGREVVEVIGYYNEDYFAYTDDQEYSYRAAKAGFGQKVDFTSCVYHTYHEIDECGMDQVPPHVFFFTIRNGYFFWKKFTPWYKQLNFRRKYFVWVLKRVLKFQKGGLTESVDAFMDGLYCGYKGIAGPWNKDIKMPSRIKNFILNHPFGLIDFCEFNVPKISTTILRKLRLLPNKV